MPDPVGDGSKPANTTLCGPGAVSELRHAAQSPYAQRRVTWCTVGSLSTLPRLSAFSS
jgi:hypothetical protein